MFKKCRLTFENDFHDTTATAYGFFKEGSDAIYITRRQVKRLHDALCGSPDCTCGDIAGCRPEMVADEPGFWCEVDATPDYVLDGRYQWDYPAATLEERGRLRKKEAVNG